MLNIDTWIALTNKFDTIKDIAEHLNQPYSRVYYHIKKENLGGKFKRKVLSSEQRLRNNVRAVTDRRRSLKQQAIDYLGGKCCICGYDRCNAALDFHHRDPKTKEFAISGKGLTRSWDSLRVELDKCMLVCNRCHAEIHHCSNECDDC